MSSAPQSRIERTVAKVLKREAKNGRTTRSGATALVFGELTAYKPIDEWITASEKIMLFKNKISLIVKTQLKAPFDASYYKLPKLPLELQLERMHAWLALGEGPNAPWVPTVRANLEQLQIAYELLKHKRKQAQSGERKPLDLKLWLEAEGYQSLMDIADGDEDYDEE